MSKAPPLVPAPRQGELPLSFAQQRMWFLARLDAGGFAYNAPFFVRLEGPLDGGVLQRALAELVRRHEALRTTFPEVEGRPVQRVAPELEVALPVEELQALDATARTEAVRQRTEAEARRPFDLAHGPLLRARLLRVSRDEHVLLLVMHHIVCDGWSFGVMERELTALYRALSTGEPPALPELPVQYADYAVWQRRWLTNETLKPSLAWWKQQLAGAPPALELPTDRPRPPVKSFRGALLPVPLSPALSQEIRALGRREGATLFMTLLAGFQALLARYSGQSDIIVGSPSSGRNTRAIEGLVGLFIHMLPLRVESSDAWTFRELLRRVRQTCLDAYAHQDVPLEQIVDALRTARDPSRTPLFQVSFALQSSPCSELRLPGVAATEPVFEPGVAKFDLTLFVRETESGLVGIWEYDTALFDKETVARMAAHYARLLEAATARPELPLAQLPLLSEAERHQVLSQWNDTRGDFPREACIHSLFEAQVARTPDAVAVETKDSRLTYAQLDHRANQLARYLLRRGVRPGDRVGLCVRRSLGMGVGLLGILKAGAAYVPLDPGYPRERLALMSQDCGAAVLLTEEPLRDLLSPDVAKVCLDGDAEAIAREEDTPPEVPVWPESPAYAIYTSGSTGRPKGALISHRALANHMAWLLSAFGLRPGDRILQKTPLSFDASVWECWAPLLVGGPLVLAPPEAHRDPAALVDCLVRQRITVLQVVPSLLRLLLEEPALSRATHLRWLFCGGEALATELAPRLRARLPQVRLVNLYGPTEVTIDATSALASGEETGATVPIGRPVANTRAYVLDGLGQPVPPGIPGELFLGGEGLAHGYLGQPALTAERFIPDAFSGTPGARLYRTGDRARWLRDGTLEYLGRMDAQVKVRGVRVEPGEVQAALTGHPRIREAVAVAREDGPGGKRLVAYVVPRAEPTPTSAELRAFLADRLPEYMVPSAWVVLPALPLLPNGKVDTRALPAPDLEQTAEEHVPPRTFLEQVVADSWALLMGLSRVGANDHFFERGGHSLLATQVTSHLRAVLGVELPVRAVFEAPTVAQLAERLQSLREDARGWQPPSLAPTPREAPPPLSFAQQRLWFIEQLAPGGFSYNVPLFARLTGPLDVAALEYSLGAIVQRHEALRTTFTEMDGQPVQRIAPELALTLPVEALETLTEAERYRELQRRAELEAQRPFDLRRGPLIRAKLLRLAASEHVLLLVLHHIVCDGWSLGVLLRELEALYRAFCLGTRSSLPALPVQYADFAVWQRQWLRGEVLETQLAWWKEQLAGAPPVLELPTDRPRPPVQSFRGAFLMVPLPAALSAELRRVCLEERVTLFMALLAGFQALLSRYSGQPDIVIGSPIAGRNRQEVESLIGFFVNTLALRIRADGDASFRELLRRVRETCLGAYAHQEVPFEQLVEALKPTRDLSRSPLFQVMFALQNAPTAMELSGVSLEALDLQTGMAKFDLTLLVRETEAGLVGFWEYNTALFDEETVARMAAHYARLLEAATARPELSLAKLPLLSEAERLQVLVQWNDTRVDFPREACIHALFEAQVARTPDAVALEHEGACLTYAQLNHRANQLAWHLRRLGVSIGTPVGLCAGRSLELVVAVVAILKAGGAYVPLDASYPSERLAFMAEDTGVPVLLVQPKLASRLPPLAARVVRLEPSWDAFAHERSDDPGVHVDPQSLAYVMYTSGSTGQPKGVCVPHRAVVRLVRGSSFVEWGPGEVFLQLAPSSFDASTLELWGALLHGAKLVIFSEHTPTLEELGRALVHHGITTLWLTSALFEQMMSTQPEALAHVRQLLAGGDVLSPARVRERLAAGALLVNGYGPTENTTFSTCHRMTRPEQVGASVSIGQPIANSQAYVLDERMQPVPVGVEGELYVGGDGLAWGYLRRPELTAERFVPHPFSEEPGARLYRTGDRARWLRDGRLEFLGRRDTQVKLRGFRIEPGEVEAALLRHPAVREAVVVAREDGPGGKRLVAYVVPRAAPAPTAAELRGTLQNTLPEYMVPSAFVTLEALPLTPNAKVDRKALPAPDLEGPREDFVPPRTAMEERVAAIWGPLLGLSRVGAKDHFFERGGHSLLATQVVSRLREALQVEVPVRTLFEAPTVAELAEHLESLAGARQTSRVPPLAPVPREGPLSLSFAQQRLWFIDRMEPGSPVYNITLALKLEGVLDTPALERAFHALTQRHESLRTLFRQDEHGASQVIAPEAQVPLAEVDLRGLREDLRAEEAHRRVHEEARRPFDLTTGPLLRLVLLRLSDAEQVLVLAMHHIISDGWSLGVLLRELRELYTAFAAGRTPSLPALPVQYADYAQWQRQWLRGEVLETQLGFWREQLAGAPSALELPTDRPRPSVQTFRGAIHRLHLPQELAEGLRQLGQREGATLFMTLLAGFQALLSRYSGQSDIVIGSPIAGRNRPEVESLIGFFVNTLVLRARVSPEAPFRSLLRQVRETALGAYAHPDLPFEQLVEALKPPRDLSRSPLFQVMFALQNAPAPALELPGLAVRLVELDGRVSRYDLSLAMWESPTGLEGTFEYNTDLFDAATMARMAGHLRAVLEAVVADANRPVRELPLLSEAERHQLLVEWNGPRVDSPRDVCLHTLFEAHARARPEALAVTSPGSSLTYGALEARANQLAHHLRAQGVGPERVVALLVERSVDFVVGALGILKAGGAYLPMDPAHPAERLRQLVRDSHARAVVTQRALLPAIQGVGAHEVCLDAEPALDLQPTHAPRTEVLAENLAYLIYTSGSAGRPKGVAVAHSSVGNLVRWYHQTYAVTPEDRGVIVAGLAFDATVLDLWAPLTAGASVHLPSEELRAEPRRLVQWMADEAMTLGFLPTPMMEAVLDDPWPESLRMKVLITAGDRLHRRPGPEFRTRLVNAYGPTEGTVAATMGTVDSQGEQGVLPHIGRPLANVRVYVLDGALQPVPVGVWGELYLGGQGLARGYLDSPALTAERFLPNPFDPEPGARMYRTGDVVRWRLDGNLEFGGRSDTQVKLRGFRIEPGEIEAALLAHSAVREAVVVAREDGPGGKQLVAYCVPSEGEPPTSDALRTFLRRTLPEHMVPSFFVLLERLPLTPNGKPDRRALPAPQRSESSATFLAPREGLEQSLATIWAQVLRLDRVGANDNFFDLGGTSLLLQAVHVKVEALVGRGVPLVDLLRHPTVQALATHLSSDGKPVAPLPAPATSSSGESRRENLRRMAQRRGRSGPQ